jgi:hypothetical protein
MFGKKNTFDRIKQYRVLFHAENVICGTFMSEYGTVNNDCGNIHVNFRHYKMFG